MCSYAGSACVIWPPGGLFAAQLRVMPGNPNLPMHQPKGCFASTGKVTNHFLICPSSVEAGLRSPGCANGKLLIVCLWGGQRRRIVRRGRTGIVRVTMLNESPMDYSPDVKSTLDTWNHGICYLVGLRRRPARQNEN